MRALINRRGVFWPRVPEHGAMRWSVLATILDTQFQRYFGTD
jgi:hypothetical protein